MSSLKEKIRNKEIVIGTQSFLGSTQAMDVLSATGYDFVFICAEHTHYSPETLYHLVKSCKVNNTPSLIRLPELDLTYTKKALDMGADAVLFPMIKTAEEAKQAMDMCLYPPKGVRGFGPMGAVNYGICSEAEYVENNEESLVRMIQIEHISCINNLKDIIKNKNIDAYIFGPNDLASSLGHIGDMYNEEVVKEIEKGAKILRDNDCRFGVSLGAIDIEKLKWWKSIGATIFSLGSDFAFMRDTAIAYQKQLEKEIK